MYLLTSQEMRNLDDLSINRDRIPSLRLMENAGTQVFRIIQKKFKNLEKKKITIFCGPGNNGGDGLVVARLLLKKKASVFVFILSEPDRLSLDARVQFDRIKDQFQSYQFVDSFSAIKTKYENLDQPHLILDALFGTGLSRPLKGLYAQVIHYLNKQDVMRMSVDIPSGLCADTGKTLGVAFEAHDTVTFGFAKRGFFFRDGNNVVGELHVVPIGLSVKAIKELSPQTHVITKGDIKDLLKPRKKNTNKGTYGHVFTLAGSLNKMGAGIMAAETALRAGAGLSTLVLPESAYGKVDPNALEIMYKPLADKKKGVFFRAHLTPALKVTQKASVVALGPGLGTKPDTVKFVQNFYKCYKGPLVVDADGLNALAKRPSIIGKRRGGVTFLTPHPGEMGRLVKKSIKYIQSHRLEVASGFAKKYGVYLLLKGYRSLIAFPNGEIWVNPTGSAAMASAGQGDVLTGIYAGLLSQFLNKKEAFLFGSFLHGLVGDLLAGQGHRVVLAMDIAKNLHLAYTFFQKGTKIRLRN